MIVEYVPTAEDAAALRRAVVARQWRHPLIVMVFAGAGCIGVGGGMMAAAGSPVWVALPLAALIGATGLWLGFRKLARQNPPALPFNDTPYRIAIAADGLTYTRGPFRARAAWAVFDRLIETPEYLILMERRAPGALAYGLAKRELERAGGVGAWRDELKARLNGAKGATRV